MNSLAFFIAKTVGALATFVASRVGNGSVIGGRLALVIFPGFIRHARRWLDFPIVFVMGSNGKTTTAKYLVHLAEESGERVLTNAAGSNMKTGIAALIIGSWRRIVRGHFSLGVFEIDEAYAASLGADVNPEFAIITNVQIDQIYRLFEPERVAAMFRDTIPFVTRHIVVNGNDRLLVDAVTQQRPLAEVSFFGIDSRSSIDPETLGLFAAQRFDQRPESSVSIDSDADGYRVTSARERFPMTVPTAGMHFALNGAAALAMARVALDAGVAFRTHVERLGNATPAFGRGESIFSGSARFELVLFKNRPSLQLNLDAYQEPADSIVLAFDEYSQDPSWLFAVDYSSVPRVDAVSGEKADFLELALAYAGVEVGVSNPDIVSVVSSLDESFRNRPEHSVHRLFLDYDQMMATRSYFGLKMGASA